VWQRITLYVIAHHSSGIIGVKWSLAKVKVKVILAPTASLPVCLGVRHQRGYPRPFLFSSFLLLFLGSCGFVDVGRPLWREVESVFFSVCWTSRAQTFSGLSPMGLMSIFYCLYFWDSPNLEGQVPVFISPKNRVAQLRAMRPANLTWFPWFLFLL
jgi:hypothetical protein